MMKNLVDSQAEDGMWRQLIDKKESFKETSSTAMFGFAITFGVNKRLLPGNLSECINKSMECSHKLYWSGRKGS